MRDKNAPIDDPEEVSRPENESRSDKSTSDSTGHFGAAYALEDPEATRAHYRSWAESYDREVAGDNGYAQPARAATALKHLADDTSIEILDAGCGSGLSGEALRAAGFSVIDGVDFSPEMLAVAASKQVYRSLAQADLNGSLAIESNRYDALVIVGVFSFGHVMPTACRELLRIIKPGAPFIIALNEQFWDRGDLAEELNALSDSGALEIIAKEFGEHLPGAGVKGWVIICRKAQAVSQ